MSIELIRAYETTVEVLESQLEMLAEELLNNEEEIARTDTKVRRDLVLYRTTLYANAAALTKTLELTKELLEQFKR